MISLRDNFNPVKREGKKREEEGRREGKTGKGKKTLLNYACLINVKLLKF